MTARRRTEGRGKRVSPEDPVTSISWNRLRTGPSALREGGHVFGLPAHCGVDARASAGMVEEDHLFERAGIKFAVVSQFEIDDGFTVGLAGGIDSKNVSFIFLGSSPGIGDRGQH